jgi:hypothetical protein
MTCLDIAELDRVRGGEGGGPNRTDVQTGDGAVHTERTDFAYCQDVVQRNCQTANTSWLFGTNQRAAAQCTLDNLPKACPPSLSGGSPQP